MDAQTVDEHILVAQCELAAAKFLNLPFDPETGLGDLYQVKASNRHDALLVLTERDDPNSIYILVTTEGEGHEGGRAFQIHGWIYGWKGMKPEYKGRIPSAALSEWDES
jgi:hypothetical protein